MRSGTARSRDAENPAPYQVLAYEEIASRAYQHYLDRRSTDGYDIDDWLPAEGELARERTDQQQPPLRRSGTPKPEAG